MYGYRRVLLVLRKIPGFEKTNHKRVLRIMRELGLLCLKFTRRSRQKYSSFKGKVGKIASNKLNRNFQASKPNQKWVTDVTEFTLRGIQPKFYLSPIIDLYNQEVVSFSLSQRPTIEFTTNALDKALETVTDPQHLTIHTDQGFHYQHRSWVKRLEDKGVRQSMSRKGNCLDNAVAENFFGLLKQEMFHGEVFHSIEELRQRIVEYITWYNNYRIKTNLKGMSPVEFRKHAS